MAVKPPWEPHVNVNLNFNPKAKDLGWTVVSMKDDSTYGYK